MTRLKPPRQILTLHKTVQHGKVILQKRVFLMHRLPLLLFVFSLFSLYPFPLLNTQPKKKKDNIVFGPSIYILLILCSS